MQAFFLFGPSAKEPFKSIIFVILFLLSNLYLTVVELILIYKMWKAIQDGHARTTPGRSIGLFFIPLFGFYWIFHVLPGFATDYNKLVDRYSLNVPKLNRGLFITYSILTILIYSPFFIISFPAFLIVKPILFSKICNAVNSLPEQFRLRQIDTIVSENEQHKQIVSPTRKTSSLTIVAITVSAAIMALIIIGLITAIVVPNIIIPKQKAYQKKTMSDINKIAKGLEYYLVDNESFPDQKGCLKVNSTLYKKLTPFYMRSIPLNDQWGNPLQIYCGEACNGQYGLSGCNKNDYLIISFGKDGIKDFWMFDKFDQSLGMYHDINLNSYNNDLVLFNGKWIRCPILYK